MYLCREQINALYLSDGLRMPLHHCLATAYFRERFDISVFRSAERSLRVLSSSCTWIAAKGFPLSLWGRLPYP